MSEITLGLLIGGLALLLYLLYKFAYAPYLLLRKYGINSPPATPFLGHYRDRVKMNALVYDQMLCDKYGPIFGYYIGSQAFIVINDLDMVKQILVKDFDNFTDHIPTANFLTDDPEPQDLFTSRGEKWKGMRRVISPSFSTSKMKMMVPHLKKNTKNLVTVMGEKAAAGEAFNVFPVYDAFTLEAILSTGFGHHVDIQLGESDEFAKAMTTAISGFQDGQLEGLIVLNSYFVRLIPLMFKMMSYTSAGKVLEYVKKSVLDLIRARREERNSDKYKDLLQLMVNATGEEDEDNEEQGVECLASKPPQRKTKGAMTDTEVFANAVAFMGAATNTTATVLSFTSYLLSLHPDVQEKLQSEIDDYFEEKPDANLYTAAQEITSVENVVQESLRIYPPGPETHRHCPKTTVVNGLTIPKGAIVAVPIGLIHRSPLYWNDPEKFDPGRFSPEEKAKRPQLSYMPFGFGPRICIGMRLALLETKIALIQVLKKYTFVRTPETEVPPKLGVGVDMRPKSGIYLKVESRQ